MNKKKVNKLQHGRSLFTWNPELGDVKTEDSESTKLLACLHINTDS